MSERGAWRYLRGWVTLTRQRLALNEPDGPKPRDGEGLSRLTLGPGLDGRWFGTFDLEAADGEVLANAVEYQLQAMWDAQIFNAHDGLAVAERRARALVEVITRGTRGGDEDGTARPLVLALVDAATLTRPDRPGPDVLSALVPDAVEADALRVSALSRSGPVSTATIRRLVCEGSVCPVIVGQDGDPLSMGRTIRIANRQQRRALRIRDGHCVFAGCRVIAEHCIAHHLVHWEHGGPTDLEGLALVCRYHHRLIHEGGFGLERDDRGRFTTYRPDGTPIDGCCTDPPLLHRRRPPPDHHPGDDPDKNTRAIRRADTLMREARARRWAESSSVLAKV